MNPDLLITLTAAAGLAVIVALIAVLQNRRHDEADTEEASQDIAEPNENVALDQAPLEGAKIAHSREPVEASESPEETPLSARAPLPKLPPLAAAPKAEEASADVADLDDASHADSSKQDPGELLEEAPLATADKPVEIPGPVSEKTSEPLVQEIKGVETPPLELADGEPEGPRPTVAEFTDELIEEAPEGDSEDVVIDPSPTVSAEPAPWNRDADPSPVDEELSNTADGSSEVGDTVSKETDVQADASEDREEEKIQAETPPIFTQEDNPESSNSEDDEVAPLRTAARAAAPARSPKIVAQPVASLEEIQLPDPLKRPERSERPPELSEDMWRKFTDIHDRLDAIEDMVSVLEVRLNHLGNSKPPQPPSSEPSLDQSEDEAAA